jgi:hypothetical protein
MLRPSCRPGSFPVACSFWGRKNVFTQPGSFSEVDARIGEGCFAPINRLRQSGLSGPKSARNGSGRPHSITFSARSRNDSGIVSPSALAVVRLITSANLVGCSTGRSAGFAPRRILSTSSAARALLRWVQIALKPASKTLGLHRVFIRGQGLKYAIADSTFKRM